MIKRLLIIVSATLVLLLGFPISSLAVDSATFQLDSSSSEQEVKASDWTDYNDSDPGVTLLEAVSSEGVESEEETVEALVKPKVEPKDTTKEGIDNEDIGVTEEGSGIQYKETDLEFINRSTEDATDKDHKGEIDILSTSAVYKEQKGNVEYTWKVEEGEGVQAPAMNKSDLIESISSKSDGGLQSVDLFLKIDDIKGESSDEEAKSSKPKEIVVVGSKVRDEDVPQIVLPTDDPEYPADSFFDITFVASDEDLVLNAVAVAQNDENIEEVTISDESVSVGYTTTVKLLGFIPVKTSQKATVTFGDGERGTNSEELGRVKVVMPWWHVFGRKTVRPHDLKAAIEEELAVENVTLNFAQVRARAFQTLSNIMKTKHDTAKSAINNIR